MIKIDHSILESLSQQAKASDRLRKNKNYHPQLEDPLQRLLNAMEPGTYVQPHKHEDPDKREMFVILKGRILVVEFDAMGNITDHTVLDAAAGMHAVEIPARAWHTVLSLAEGSVVIEFKDGPYNSVDDKNFAAWAPAEGDSTCREYNQKLLKALNLSV